MKCSEEAVQLIHEYLDEEIAPENEKKLHEHLNACPDCHIFFEELKKTDAFLKQQPASIKAPANFTANVMAQLPQVQPKKSKGIKNWIKFHPFLTAASMFIVLMAGSLVSNWQNDQFSVTNQANLVVQQHNVIVPKGEVVKGDIVVKNGDLTIEGEVQGNVTVINGDHYLASAGHVTGEIEEIDKVFEWLWYKIKDSSTKVVSVFK